MIILKILFIFLLLFYCALIIYLMFKWNEIPFFRANCQNYYTTLSIIVPFRNEEKNLPALIESLLKQDYPSVFYEIILINDHSRDKSLKIAQEKREKAKTMRINLKVLQSEGTGKKDAITQAVKLAAGELIISTDADCSFNRNWLKSIACYYQQFNFDAASGPVQFKRENSIWKKFQELEFISLISTGAASVEAGFPIMCNGANLVFKREVFWEVGGYEALKTTPSGDDVLLFQKLSKRNKKLAFIKSEDTVVSTQSANSFKDIFNQRIRWASKTTANFYFPSFVVAGIVFLFNLSILITGIGAFFSSEMFRIFIFIFSIKFIIDGIFFNSVLKFFKRKKLLFLFLPAEIIYPFYVVITGSLAPFLKYNWKGRTHG